MDYDLSADPPWLATPLALGSLKEEIEDFATDYDRFVDIFRQILAGIRYAHQHNVIHRDLKPQNILMFADDVVKIGDFGIGKRLDPNTFTMTLTHSQEVLGTIYYAAPEQMKNLINTDYRTDIYALGKILYETLTGELPFPTVDLGEVDTRYHYLIAKCTAPKPDKRFQTIDELLEVFDMVTGQSLGVSVILPSTPNDIDSLLSIRPSLETVNQLNQLFIRNAQNKKLYHTYFPQLSGPYLGAYWQYNPVGFRAVLHRYDHHVSGNLPFKYCDTVARLYREIFNLPVDPAIQRVVLQRLLTMGELHNRWFVLQTACGLIGAIRAPGLALVALEVIKENPTLINRLSEPLLKRNPVDIIEQAIMNTGNDDF